MPRLGLREAATAKMRRPNSGAATRCGTLNVVWNPAHIESEMTVSAVVAAIGDAARHDGRCARKTPPSQQPRRNSGDRTSGFSVAPAPSIAKDEAAALVAPSAISAAPKAATARIKPRP